VAKAADGGFEHIQAFFDTTRGQITIGEIPPIRRAALAAVGKRARGIGRMKHPLGKCLRGWIVFGAVCGVKSLVWRAAGGPRVVLQRRAARSVVVSLIEVA
jgi:hypothetical protein